MVRDHATVEGFGREWQVFDQQNVDELALRKIFDDYFSEFPWRDLPKDPVGIDVGCGSGRWAQFVAQRAHSLFCIDPSDGALKVASARLRHLPNCHVVEGAAGELPIRPGSLDFGYSLGVLHHTPDPEGALQDCVAKLRPGAPFLIYLYYAFDNKPGWFRLLWRASDVMRRGISRLPFRARYWCTQALAAVVYWPLARLALVRELTGGNVETMPLSFYRAKPFYVMRNDALDRFGTRLEKRFTAFQIRSMMEAAGLGDIVFSQRPPHWCVTGRRVSEDP